MLLVATPLVMLRNFLQQAISGLSDLKMQLFGLALPTILVVVAVAALALLIWQFRNITRFQVLGAVIVILMDAVAQLFADLYSDHEFYDLQQNWHYVAYSLFALVLYCDLGPRGVPLQRIQIYTFLGAFLMSSFDEAFQMFINTRIFDVSDIAKDTYGAVAGMVLISLSRRNAPTLLRDRRLRYPRLRDYFRHPLTTLILLGSLSFFIMMYGALLSDRPYFLGVIALALVTTLLLWLLLHLSQFKLARSILLAVVIVAIVTQTSLYIRYRDDGIVYNRHGLTIYKGFIIPFFDVLIYPDGNFRLVDKKHEFFIPDRRFFMKHRPDILLIGSGSQGRGGNGFPSRKPSQFVYNPFTDRGTHVIILNTRDACITYNRLLKEHKHVLFVLHNTC